MGMLEKLDGFYTLQVFNFEQDVCWIVNVEYQPNVNGVWLMVVLYDNNMDFTVLFTQINLSTLGQKGQKGQTDCMDLSNDYLSCLALK